MYNTIASEDLNKPAAALVNKDFALDARSAASGRGMPGLRIIPENVPCESTIAAEIEAGVSAAIDDIVAALTRPLTAEEKSPKPKEVQRQRIVFKGSLGEVNRFFYRSGWGDGLPIIPPTEEAVQEMLTGTDLPADHIVGKIIPRLGKAAVEKIAINAVMAGALPTYMPVLIAGVQALLDPKADFGTYEVSTGSWSPFWIMNGPIRHDLNVNSGAGALSPGDIANAAIGRAMGLIIKNIGGARKGVEDMGVLGNPGKYTLVIAENEEANPWEPLHVEQGLKKEDSAVSVFFPNSFWQTWPYGTDDKGIITSVIHNLLPGRMGLCLLILHPSHAKIMASKGWTKKEIIATVSEYARVPAYHHPQYWGTSPIAGVPKKEHMPSLNPMDPMPILRNPNWIRIIVAGGPGNFWGFFGGSCFINDWVTKKIELPANWGKLVEKYKNVEPTYAYY